MQTKQPPHLIKLSTIILIGLFLLTACSTPPMSTPAKNIGAAPLFVGAGSEVADIETKTVSVLSPTPLPTHTAMPSETQGPTHTPFFTPTTAVPSATSTPRPTTTPVLSLCDAPATHFSSETSPDGKWDAIACMGKYGVIDSYMRVVSLQGNKEWVIHYADYASDKGYERIYTVFFVFRWTHDGKYLYASLLSPSEGCCWIGHKWLLVRLNLENGQQTEIINYIGYSPAVDFSMSSDDRYLMYIPQGESQHLSILDLFTWKKRVIELDFENSGAGYTVMSDDNEKAILMLIDSAKGNDSGIQLGSLVVIDLLNGRQRKVFSGMEYEKIPIPVQWQDDDHVLLQQNSGYWLLNIRTGVLTQTTNP